MFLFLLALWALLCIITCTPSTSAPSAPSAQPVGPKPEGAWKIDTGCPFSPWGALDYDQEMARGPNAMDKFQWYKSFDGAKLPHTCYECRWCPHKEPSCCEEGDELDLLQGIRVSGQTDWDCFISIVKYQECGKCSSESWKFTSQSPDTNPAYIYLPNRISKQFPNLHIRPCRGACERIWDACYSTQVLGLDGKVTGNRTRAQMCGSLPVSGNCYNSAVSIKICTALLFVIALLTFTLVSS